MVSRFLTAAAILAACSPGITLVARPMNLSSSSLSVMGFCGEPFGARRSRKT
jgi:hypothetical protein